MFIAVVSFILILTGIFLINKPITFAVALSAEKEKSLIPEGATVQATGTSGGYEGAAAVLGSSNIIQLMEGISKSTGTSRKSKK